MSSATQEIAFAAKLHRIKVLFFSYFILNGTDIGLRVLDGTDKDFTPLKIDTSICARNKNTIYCSFV